MKRNIIITFRVNQIEHQQIIQLAEIIHCSHSKAIRMAIDHTSDSFDAGNLEIKPLQQHGIFVRNTGEE